MGDLLRDGARMLNGAAREHVSQTVTYQRGSATVSLQATIGSSSGYAEREHGHRERWTARDFLIPVADLLLDGDRVEPERGDRILETEIDENDEAVAEVTHEVALPSDDEPAWRFSDAHRIRYRIHTKQVGRVPLP